MRVVVLFSLLATVFGACPTNWIQSAANPNKCFYMENAAVEFQLVPQLCRDRAGSDEAKPVTIANAFENEELRSTASPWHGNGNPDINFWLGVRRLSNGTFVWYDGTPMSYAAWDPTSSGSNDGLDCARMFAQVGWWQKLTCNALDLYSGFACELRI